MNSYELMEFVRKVLPLSNQVVIKSIGSPMLDEIRFTWRGVTFRVATSLSVEVVKQVGFIESGEAVDILLEELLKNAYMAGLSKEPGVPQAFAAYPKKPEPKKDDELDNLTEKIRGYFKKWDWIVTRYGWRFDINYYAKTQDMPRGIVYSAMMSCAPNVPYLEGVIAVDLEVCSDDVSDDELEEAVVHEIVHLLLSLMRETDEVRLEQTVVWVSRAFIAQDRRK